MNHLVKTLLNHHLPSVVCHENFKESKNKTLGGGRTQIKLYLSFFPLNDYLQEKVLITLDKACHLNFFYFLLLRLGSKNKPLFGEVCVNYLR